MNIYQILTLVISFFSVIISIIAVLIAYLPYSKKIIFSVSLNPFTKSDAGIEICFLIINKTNKDLIVESLTASKILSVQIFDKDDFTHLVKANDSERFSINSSKLKFNFLHGFYDKSVVEKEKHLKYIKFCILNSVRESITYKMRLKDYNNACRMYELYRKNREGKGDLASHFELHNEILYFFKKNKSR